MHIGDFHQAPVHAYRARIVDMYDDPGTYAPAYYRLCLCKCGSGEFYDDNDTPHEVGAGDMFWFTPGTPRKWRRTSKSRWIVSYITFGGSARKDGLPELLGLDFKSRVLHVDEAVSRRIEQLLYNASVQYSEDTEAGNVIMHSIIYEILCELRIALGCGRSSDSGVSYDFSGVIAYIRRNIKDDLSIDRICAGTGMSRGKLFSEFKRALDMSPGEFITAARMERAAELLLQSGDMTVREVALEVGISGAGYFTKLFKDRYGVTPGEYRCGKGRRKKSLVRQGLPVTLTNAGDTCDGKLCYADISDRNSYQLMYCTGGSGIVTDDNGNKHTITPGMICFFSPDSEAVYEPLDSRWGVIWLRFSGKRLSGFTRYLGFDKSNVIGNSRNFRLEYLYKRLIYGVRDGYDFEGAFTELYKNAWRTDFEGLLRSSVRLYELLIYTAILSEDEENLSTPEEQRLLPAVELVRTGYGEKLTNKQLAMAAGISEMHLLRLFKVVFRKTPKEYVTEYRMEQAKRMLLRHPNRPVKRIAGDVGYTDTTAFAAAFKNYSGFSPNDYRNINL